jgi:C4-dicarboxylate-specific signal transduction histidine kinase
MKTPAERPTNQIVQQTQRRATMQRLAKNREASEDYIKKVYPNEKFLSRTAQLQAANQWTKKLVLPKNVRLAESRIPRDKDHRDILKKELHQAGKLSRLGNSIFFYSGKGRL